MITVTRLEPGHINFCQACQRKAEYRMMVKKTRKGTGELLKSVTTILTLCSACCKELCEALPNKKDYVEIQHEREYDKE